MLLIFDFDGVVADSEMLACVVAARYARELGGAISDAEGLSLFLGKRAADVAAIMRDRGASPPSDVEARLLELTLDAFAEGLSPVVGVEDFLRRHAHLPRCIASSSSHARLRASLDALALGEWFEGRVFSADDVMRGKPWPDLFLHAARTLREDPQACVVIEDSPGGVQAGVAAGMRVIGLVAGSHVGSDHEQVLRDAGAHSVARDYKQIDGLIAAWMTSAPSA